MHLLPGRNGSEGRWRGFEGTAGRTNQFWNPLDSPRVRAERLFRSSAPVRGHGKSGTGIRYCQTNSWGTATSSNLRYLLWATRPTCWLHVDEIDQLAEWSQLEKWFYILRKFSVKINSTPVMITELIIYNRHGYTILQTRRMGFDVLTRCPCRWSCQRTVQLWPMTWSVDLWESDR